MYEKYMRLYKDSDDVIYLREEICGIELDSVRMNLITRATVLNFFQFFTERYRTMPLLIRNEKEYLQVAKELVMDKDEVKAGIRRIGPAYIAIDMTSSIDDESYRVGGEFKVVKDVRKIFENV